MNDNESHFGIVTGVIGDTLESINLKFANLKFVKTKSIQFQKFITEIKDVDNRYNNYLSEELKNLLSPESYAIIPVQSTTPVSYESIYDVQKLCLTIEPSYFLVKAVFGFRIEDGQKFEFFSYYSSNLYTHSYGDYFTNLFIAKNTTLINEFIETYNTNVPKLKYMRPCIDAYSSSFESNQLTMKYLNLCIALESIVNSKTELTYRIKRNIAVLLSDDDEHGDLLFKNIGYIYELRSKIVHASKYDLRFIKEYLPYLRALTSLLIKTLISWNIKTIDELNLIINRKGYGDLIKILDELNIYKLDVRGYSFLHNHLNKPK